MNAAERYQDTVLVVDDAPESLSFLTDTLDGTGVTVLVATDGASALSLVDRVTPDLILMDAVMPGLDGFETCRRLKRDKQLADVPVIFMTGLTDTEHVLRGLQAGGVDYVAKPIVVEELLERIRVHLANARIARGTRMALDATGRFLLSTDASGRLRWSTQRAAQILSASFGSPALPPSVSEHLNLLRTSGSKSLPDPYGAGGRRLHFSYVGATSIDEFLFRLDEVGDSREMLQVTEQCERLRSSLALTQREAEVLFWLSRGKANREISTILGISHRTVNKHLEQVFEKLGVEKRSAATARAVRCLERWS